MLCLLLVITFTRLLVWHLVSSSGEVVVVVIGICFASIASHYFLSLSMVLWDFVGFAVAVDREPPIRCCTRMRSKMWSIRSIAIFVSNRSKGRGRRGDRVNIA